MQRRRLHFLRWAPLAVVLLCGMALPAFATPANRAALEKHYDRFLSRPLAKCTTCHLPSEQKFPESLAEFPHNPFGDRLRELGEQLEQEGAAHDLASRLVAVAREDSDGDGVANETELLLGHSPGDPKDVPSAGERALADIRSREFAEFLSGYRWQPFEPVRRPELPKSATPAGFVIRNPVDTFLAADWQRLGLQPRPEAPREVLLRRVYLDLIGLSPTPAEQEAFLADTSPRAYEQVVERLLADPRHGERWARHWMDVWRYSDWAGWADGNQIRDSKPHIWRWRDWIVESLHADKPYDRMVTEMLAADELAPGDPDALRATGFLVRNYKMLSREQWLEDTVKHTSQAFLGVTMGCAKCHDHMFDPISQKEYYALRAVFEPHQVRTDRSPGELDTSRDGVVRAYDATNAPTWFLVRGDERNPVTNAPVAPGVPTVLGGRLEVSPVALPWEASHPDGREFVIRDVWSAGSNTVAIARKSLEEAHAGTNAPSPDRLLELSLALDAAEKRQAALEAVLAWEDGPGGTRTSDPSEALRHGTNTLLLQQTATVAEAMLARHRARMAVDAAATNAVADARKKFTDASRKYDEAVEALAKPLTAAYQRRPAEVYPTESSGRRLALARWMVRPQNPLTARVAVNHVWLRHFGRGIVSSPADFGRNGRPPTQPQLLDWLAAEFMEPTWSAGESGGAAKASPWSFRHLHRLLVTSSAYRMASTPDDADLAADPDNLHFWRMNSRRLEAEAVRDNLLYVAGKLDPAMGGPDIDHREALTSVRRSIYLRHAAEKQAEFLQIFDGAGVTECYERHPSVMPQQALAMGNSELALRQARSLATTLATESGGDEGRFVERAFQRILARRPTPAETRECRDFLEAPIPAGVSAAERAAQRTRENLILVLLNHSDFVTVR
ncbi:MAG: DUF1553 domain-containing protein [Verrucomicrobiales bacterium]|nr:DUF1553 domain-containing protein [Verrucomicrobiales bacterium]